MNTLSLQERIISSSAFERVLQFLRAGKKDISVGGISGSLKSLLLAFLFKHTGKQILYVAPEMENAERVKDDLGTLIGTGLTSFYSHDMYGTEALQDVTFGKRTVMVSYAEAIAKSRLSVEAFRKKTVRLQVAANYKFEAMKEQLLANGFEKKGFVESYGDFAIRGGIVDVFPYAGNNPVRIEFLGDTVDSIREFDLNSQRSITGLQTINIVPSMTDSTASDTSSVIFDFIPADSLLFLDEPDLIRAEIEKQYTDFGKADSILGVANGYSHLSHRSLNVPQEVIDFKSYSQPAFNGSAKALGENVAKLLDEGFTVAILCGTEEQVERLRELISDLVPAELGKRDYYLLSESLQNGFVFPQAKVAVYTDHEIFGRYKRPRTTGKKHLKGLSVKELQEIRRGDFVVHVDYGIGRFAGLEKIRIKGSEQECVKLLYEDNDVLFVNLDYVNRIQKYSSQDGYTPRLSKLGTQEWEGLKAKAKSRIKDIARDLIQLYALRKHEQGFGFAKDTHWQRELEASFIYEDTPDQATATRDVKFDMESENPMDRLICGDVGYGKTEVAIRAAFKAVMDGKQVAVLAPTTILTEQHFNSFRDRLSHFGVTIAGISRFKSKKDQQRIVGQLKEGKLDVVIGTHRLLSKDVAFKDLGLLVIDEEHRFGVAAKEKLRKFRAAVDTLTLTATPIPRTLHFSLLGARDLSIIETPPKNRKPIITEICQFNTELIRDAIMKEIKRGGQVYFVNDRVATIDSITSHLQDMVPEARLAIAHGQMKSSQLEKVMMEFMERRSDVLVCTKIIESGLDLPNVNTILVNRADKFGLAELYQLRGRVGRSNQQAYAYLLTPPVSSLSRDSIRRLQALEEFTELGSGFNLAMRDLEIRGAGNLLGAEQTGFIYSMGFSLYCKILDEAVGELKSTEFKSLFGVAGLVKPTKTEIHVEIDKDAYIPEFYIDNDSERFRMYQRLYETENGQDIQKMWDELKDRFGQPPEEVSNLLHAVEFRILGSALGFSRISISRRKMILEIPPPDKTGQDEKFDSLLRKISVLKDRIHIKQGKRSLELTVELDERNGETVRQAKEILGRLLRERQ
jgi:transcription-repair coupling factor (superfamily II helicase)